MFFFFYKDLKTTATLYLTLITIGLLIKFISDLIFPEKITLPSKSTFIVGISTEDVPVGLIKKNQIGGWNMDFVQEIARRLGKEGIIKGMPWGNFADELKKGTVHAVLLPPDNPVKILNPEITDMHHKQIDESNSFVISPKYENLYTEIDRIIEKMKKDGTFKEILKTWTIPKEILDKIQKRTQSNDNRNI